MTALPVSPADVLRRAADLVDEGWCQGRSHIKSADGGDRYCAAGAIQKVALSADIGWHAEERVIDILRGRIGGRTVSRWNIPRWNDEPGQTAEAVSAKLRAVADSLENER